MISFDTIPQAPGGYGDPLPSEMKGETMTNDDKTEAETDAPKTIEGSCAKARGALDALKPAIEAMGNAIAVIAEFSGRHKEWGDMMTDRRETGGHLLEKYVADGRLSLHLDRLSDDHTKSLEQLRLARSSAAIFTGDEGQGLFDAVTDAHNAREARWDLAPYLRAIEDAHEALGISQAWDGAKVKPAEGTEVDVKPVSIDGAAKPGWARR